VFKWKAKQLDLFWYWIQERHSIYLRRQEGQKFPWTKDKILQTYKFTNVFRQLDRVTQEWTARYATFLGSARKVTDADILFQCCMFRLFNWPETYDALYFAMRNNWNLNQALEILRVRRDEDHEQIFTGAYIVTSGGRSDPKFQVIAEALDYVHKNRHDFMAEIKEARTMETAVSVLQRVPTIGGFVGYEIACDLRHTRVLNGALDVCSWANPGPGAKRGIHRLLTGDKDYPGKKPDYNIAMRELLKMQPARFPRKLHKVEWPFEMREIEHSLCEFDKWSRVKQKEGRKPRSVYRPPKDKEEQLELRLIGSEDE
jgi:hypothetical protein